MKKRKALARRGGKSADNSGAAATPRKRPGPKKRPLPKSRKKKSDWSTGKFIGAIIIVIGGVVAGYFVVTRTHRPPDQTHASAPRHWDAGRQTQNVRPTVAQIDRRNALKTLWEEFKAREGQAYDRHVDDGSSIADSAEALWADNRFAEAVTRLESLPEIVAEIESIDEARSAALALSSELQQMVDRIKANGAADIVPAGWARAQQKLAEAASAFDAGAFEDATGRWEEARELLESVVHIAESARAADKALAAFTEDLTRRFSSQQVEEYGGEALTAVKGLIDEALRDYQQERFVDSLAKRLRAGELTYEVERAVERRVGAHYYAIAAGRAAVELLLKKAAGDPIGGDALSGYADLLGDLMFEEESVAGVRSAADADYRDFADALLERVEATVGQLRGESVRASFQIGVYLRTLEQIFAAEADSFDRGSAGEARRMALLIQKKAREADYPTPFVADAAQSLLQKMALKPTFEAVRQCRDTLADLARNLDEFDSAMTVLPASD